MGFAQAPLSGALVLGIINVSPEETLSLSAETFGASRPIAFHQQSQITGAPLKCVCLEPLNGDGD